MGSVLWVLAGSSFSLRRRCTSLPFFGFQLMVHVGAEDGLDSCNKLYWTAVLLVLWNDVSQVPGLEQNRTRRP